MATPTTDREVVPGSAPTPGQTVGPFFGYALPFDGDNELVPPGSAGAIRLHGRVTDGAGDPVPDAILELWQADADGAVVQQDGSLHRDGWTFTGWGRASTDENGDYTFTTVRPGPAGAGQGRRSSRSRSSRADCSTGCSPGPTCPDDAVALIADPLLGSLPTLSVARR